MGTRGDLLAIDPRPIYARGLGRALRRRSPSADEKTRAAGKG
jgi:hypothetical protein